MNVFNVMIIAQAPSTTPSPAPVPALEMGVGGLAILISIGVIIFIAGASYAWREKIVRWLQVNDTFRAICYVSEPILTFFLGIFVTAFDVWKPSTWSPPSPSLPTIVPLSVAIIMSAVALKFFAAWAKEKEKEKINTLEADLKSRDRENSVLKEARRHSIRIAEHVHAVVDEKLHRLAEALSKPDFSAERYFLALDSGEQLQFIIIMIREFFVSELDPGRKLRAGVYMESPPGSNLLEPLYSWDGKTRECFSQQGSKYMRLNDAEGSKSMIAQAFPTDESLLVVSSCESEERKGLFTYFRPEQKKYLKGILTYKHLWDRDVKDGLKDAIILSLDTDQDCFFGRYEKEELSEFFIEMMKRFEYEMLSLTAQDLVRRSQTNPAAS